MRLPLIPLMASSMLAACAANTQSVPSPVAPLVGPHEEVVETNYTEALECLSAHVGSQSFAPPRIAVGHITDLTGASDYFTGRRITQGAALMAMTALADSGMRVIERYDMGVIEVELNYAQNGLVRDGEQTLREVAAGQLQGADLYIVGGITEFNPNIRSSAGEVFAGSGETSGATGLIGGSGYTVDVGIDLRLVDVRSSEVLSVRSFRKQIIGREISAGVFEFFGGDIVDVNIGQRALEPVQTGVRTMIDRAVFEFVSALYNYPLGSCLDESVAHANVADGFRRRGGDSQVLRPNRNVAPTPQTGPATQAEVGFETEPVPNSEQVEVSVPAPRHSVSASPNGLALHLSSHPNRDAAMDAWFLVAEETGEILEGYRPILHTVQLDRGEVQVRLLAGPATDPSLARRTCAALDSVGRYCALYDPVAEEAQINRNRRVRSQLR